MKAILQEARQRYAEHGVAGEGAFGAALARGEYKVDDADRGHPARKTFAGIAQIIEREPKGLVRDV